MELALTIAIGVLLILLIIVLATDGSYFGKPLVRWIYDRIGPTIFSTGRDTTRWRTLAEQLDLRRDKSLLDVGTAVGEWPMAAASQPGFTGTAVGIDRSPAMIARASNIADQSGLSDRSHFQIADATEPLPFPDESFDVVTCFGLLETLPEPERVLRELVRVLRPNGVLAVSIYRSRLSSVASRRLRWYQSRLAKLGFSHFENTPFRRSHTVLIASSSVQRIGCNS